MVVTCQPCVNCTDGSTWEAWVGGEILETGLTQQAANGSWVACGWTLQVFFNVGLRRKGTMYIIRGGVNYIVVQ